MEISWEDIVRQAKTVEEGAFKIREGFGGESEYKRTI
jgi:hypothetical protein